MSKRSGNPGKREREARKRHRRARVWTSGMGAEAAPLKLGRTHLGRRLVSLLSVADSRKSGGQRALESARRSAPNSSPDEVPR